MTPASRVALVTGAAVRLGRSIALRLAKEGYEVALHYSSSSKAAQQTREEIESLQGRVRLFQADLSKLDSIRRLADEVSHTYPSLDALVCNAANYEAAELGAISSESWQRTMDLNLRAPFFLAQACLPLLRARGGSIVFVTCSSATTPFRGHLPYVVSKGAVKHLMKTLALEAAPQVRVNAVAPGTVLPPESMGAREIERLAHLTPLRKRGNAEDVASAVAYLLNAPFTTGQEIQIDGGRNLARLASF